MKQIIVGALIALALAGCSSGKPEPKMLPGDNNTGPGPVTMNSAPATKLVEFRNADGKLQCPVMGTVIENVKDATSHTDYKGKRYYFCCGECPAPFSANPKKYAGGKALKHGAAAKM